MTLILQNNVITYGRQPRCGNSSVPFETSTFTPYSPVVPWKQWTRILNLCKFDPDLQENLLWRFLALWTLWATSASWKTQTKKVTRLLSVSFLLHPPTSIWQRIGLKVAGYHQVSLTQRIPKS